jgi:hypothetical protein
MLCQAHVHGQTCAWHNVASDLTETWKAFLQGCVIQIIFQILFGCFRCEKMKATIYFFKERCEAKHILCLKKGLTYQILNWLHVEPKCIKL